VKIDPPSRWPSKGDDAVCEIAARLEYGKARIDGRTIHPHIGTVN
jgi:hypothetical protein